MEKTYTTKEVADLLNVSEATIRSRIRENKIAYSGGKRRNGFKIKESDLLEYAKEYPDDVGVSHLIRKLYPNIGPSDALRNAGAIGVGTVAAATLFPLATSLGLAATAYTAWSFLNKLFDDSAVSDIIPDDDAKKALKEVGAKKIYESVDPAGIDVDQLLTENDSAQIEFAANTLKTQLDHKKKKLCELNDGKAGEKDILNLELDISRQTTDYLKLKSRLIELQSANSAS